MASKKQSNTQELGFEEKIWKAADSMRGHIDALEYKNVVLGLIFLKYISDRFEQRHQELVDEGEGFEEDRDKYSFENIFWVPKGVRWEEIAKSAHTPEIGKVIDEAMREIEAENKTLKGILPKNFARQELDKRMLGDVVDLFTNVKMAGEGDTQDVLGRTYEYCLCSLLAARCPLLMRRGQPRLPARRPPARPCRRGAACAPSRRPWQVLASRGTGPREASSLRRPRSLPEQARACLRIARGTGVPPPLAARRVAPREDPGTLDERPAHERPSVPRDAAQPPALGARTPRGREAASTGGPGPGALAIPSALAPGSS